MVIDELAPDAAREALQRIEHIVVVMMENRSFDHMLGYLSLTGRDDVDGLQPGFKNKYRGKDYPIHHLERRKLEHDEDPDHSGKGVERQLADGNQGFARSHIESRTEEDRDVLAASDRIVVMGYYDATDVPTYDHLAENFCVCDRWFSSVPGATWPNRLYAVTGQSQGRKDNKKLLGKFDFRLHVIPAFVRHPLYARRIRMASAAVLFVAIAVLLAFSLGGGTAHAQSNETGKSTLQTINGDEILTWKFSGRLWPPWEGADPETRERTYAATPPLTAKQLEGIRGEFTSGFENENYHGWREQQRTVTTKVLGDNRLKVFFKLSPEDSGRYTGNIQLVGERIQPFDLTATATVKESILQVAAWALAGFLLGLLLKSMVDITTARAAKDPPRNWSIYRRAYLKDRGPFYWNAIAGAVVGLPAAFAAWHSNDIWGSDTWGDGFGLAGLVLGAVVTGATTSDLVNRFDPGADVMSQVEAEAEAKAKKKSKSREITADPSDVKSPQTEDDVEERPDTPT
jgi:hypothetical protein